MQNTNLLADELHSKGFRTKVITSNCVRVSLSSRKLSKMEVEIALDEIFDDITFQTRSVNNAVLVSF